MLDIVSASTRTGRISTGLAINGVSEHKEEP